MKVCDLTQFYSPFSGGVKRYVSEKVQFIRAHRPSDQHILIIPGDRDECTGDEVARTYTIASPLISKTSRYRVLLRLEAIERILEKERPDLIESGDPYQVAWKAVHSGAALGIPVIGFYHSHFPEAYVRTVRKFCGETITEAFVDFARRYVRNLYNRFERTIVPSPALGDVLTGWGVRNVFHSDLGVDTDIFRPGQRSPSSSASQQRRSRKEGEEDEEAETNLRARLGIPRDRTLLLYVGRLAQEKNTHTLFDAFRLLPRERFHLLVVGDGLQRRELAELTRDYPSQLTHLSYCAEAPRLAAIYRAADLFVHPGVQETFGLVSLEAQACGVPVIGIRGSYMDRLIHTDQAVWADENTPASLAGAILAHADEDFLHDPDALHRRVAAQYSWRQVFTRLFDLYTKVVANYRRP